ncbi:MAG: lantibiotic immunity ABC transporter MutG family permease subunit [Candidatus Cellulosilyticum pullistercoris]|uniref:Lantibiotic immunity ABC transporter MutG family permease subunit n=1 Tax=Candidatus Cellulosilyticum pullistercoris TaxID=2838521 RepID=A0A9E2NKF3_9FIRM|nr:lantibiotic immunity ABC transporter MutG family permease subunit [Candidatus Cellulosilyticum pullistercoris]
MKQFIKSYKAEVYQMIHSGLLWIHLIIPIIGVLLFCSYYSYSPWKNEDKIITYLQTLSTAFPVLIAIVVGISCEEEKNAGHFQRMLSVPYSKTISHLSKLMVLGSQGFIAVLLAVVGFGVVSKCMGNHTTGLLDYLKLAVLLFVSNLGWYMIQYIVSFQLGKGLALDLGIVGGLLSPLLALGLGDGIWQIVPCAWGIRLVSYALELIMKTGEYRLILLAFRQGFMSMLIITVLLLVMFLYWSKRWQGAEIEE